MKGTKVWQIWVDTGGTFTDCIAKDPDGENYRIKVLSNSTLRGKSLSLIGSKGIKFKASWPIEVDVFKGYYFYYLNKPEKLSVIESIDFDKKIIYFNKPISLESQDFAITANEEAPVLATRIVTKTPLSSSLPPLTMRLGSTRGTNALLENRGARCALLITRGFKDLLSIGTQQRPEIFNLKVEKPAMLYEKVFEIDERVSAQGDILEKIKENEINELLLAIKNQGINSIAIALINSYKNSIHEKRIAELAKGVGIKFIAASQKIAPAIKILGRATTAVINAYLAPVIETYLQNIKSKISRGSLKVMSSAGGLYDSQFYAAKDSLLSGPAGGVVGAVSIGKSAGFSKIITFDMGGTSTDVARYENGFDYTFETKVGNASLLSPSLSIETVAAGGGSICQYDGHKFTVGPQSAGAWPGPACYGAGGPLSITDINLLLGRIDDKRFTFKLSRNKAEEAFKKIYPAQNNREAILAGFLQIANEKMAAAVKKISVNKGFRVNDHVLVSFGGAGGQHACDVADLLNISKIIFPKDASLLSAYGMGIAQIERVAQTQILASLQDATSKKQQLLKQTIGQATNALQAEGIAEEEITIKKISWHLRFIGQDYALEIDDCENLAIAFERKYKQLYGHWISDRSIEVESLKVIAASKTYNEKALVETLSIPAPAPDRHEKIWLKEGWKNVPIFNLEELPIGTEIIGPALISANYSTFFITKNWHFSVASSIFFIAEKTAKNADHNLNQDDSVNLELFTNRFKSIASDMGAMLQRTAFSVNIKERLDFSTAILDKNGYLVVNAPHIPVHLGSLGVCLRAILKKLTLAPEDVVITNHPGYGGSHLPDITLLAAVYSSEKTLIGYVANRAHHAELGGKSPGSMPPDAKYLLEEGVIISPDYLVKSRVPQWEKIKKVLQSSLYPSRALAENIADLNAGLAALQNGIQSLQNMANTYSPENLIYYMQQIRHYTNEMMLEIFEKYEGNYKATEYLDDGTCIKVQILIDRDKAIFDFAGSSNEHAGNFNATPAIVNSAIIYVLRLLLNELPNNRALNIPLNEGILENVQINIPSGFLNPPLHLPLDKCTAVVGGNTETSQRLTDTLLKAFKLAACSQGTMNNLLYGNDKFGYYETIGGGSGASDGFEGADAVHQHMTNTAITDVEIMELRYPVRVEQMSIRQNSGGAGKWSGGNGIVRVITFLEPVRLSLLSQHRTKRPYGMAGGEDALPGIQWIIKASGQRKELAGVEGISLEAGDRIYIATPGGGGYGKGR